MDPLHTAAGSSTRVAAIEGQRVVLALHAPFAISGGVQEQAELFVVSVVLADGTVGWGEAAPLPAYNGETVEQVEQAFARGRTLLLGQEGRAFRHWAARLREELPQSAAARCAFEVALLDALSRQQHIPLHLWFGGASARELHSDITIPVVPPDVAYAQAVRYAAAGFSRLKVKVGALGDVERVRAVRQGAPHAELLLDANGGLDEAGAHELVRVLESTGAGPSVFEQPVARGAWTALEALARRGVRLAFDESVQDAGDALEVARRFGAPHLINLKLMKSGVDEARAIVAIARSAGLGLMIGGMLESNLAMSASACFAVAHGTVDWVDLDTPAFILDSAFSGGMTMHGPRIDLSAIDAGHGVVPTRR
jgi:L-Ala-D/L-Glu epimerase